MYIKDRYYLKVTGIKIRAKHFKCPFIVFPSIFIQGFCKLWIKVSFIWDGRSCNFIWEQQNVGNLESTVLRVKTIKKIKRLPFGCIETSFFSFLNRYLRFIIIIIIVNRFLSLPIKKNNKKKCEGYWQKNAKWKANKLCLVVSPNVPWKVKLLLLTWLAVCSQHLKTNPSFMTNRGNDCLKAFFFLPRKIWT